MHIGIGYDVHRLGENRKLIIGGVEIPFERGLIGHSDADVLLHAIMDALLGAAALGDIGKHFPDTDERYHGISSIKLLKAVGDMLQTEGWIIENIDATIIAQYPKMRPYIDRMRSNIARALGIELLQVSVKATTEEGLGFTGSGDGISSNAICLLSSVEELCSKTIPIVHAPEEDLSRNCESCPGCVFTEGGQPGRDKDISAGRDKDNSDGRNADNSAGKDKDISADSDADDPGRKVAGTAPGKKAGKQNRKQQEKPGKRKSGKTEKNPNKEKKKKKDKKEN